MPHLFYVCCYMLVILHYTEAHVWKLQESDFHLSLTFSAVAFLTYVKNWLKDKLQTLQCRKTKRLKLAMRLK